MSAADRTAVVKLLKARGAKARRGHLRIPVGELFWYVDVLADGVGPAAPLRLEVGCWTGTLPPEPDGGAVDCPLLMDVPLGSDPVGATTALLDKVTALGDLAALGGSLGDLPGALVDQRLRDLF